MGSETSCCGFSIRSSSKVLPTPTQSSSPESGSRSMAPQAASQSNSNGRTVTKVKARPGAVERAVAALQEAQEPSSNNKSHSDHVVKPVGKGDSLPSSRKSSISNIAPSTARNCNNNDAPDENSEPINDPAGIAISVRPYANKKTG